MRLALSLTLAILTAPLACADVAGTWQGILKFPAKTLHIVLHITGPDTALKATHDSPDRDGYGQHVDSITFTRSTLNFVMTRLQVKFSGDLNAGGTIVGTFVSLQKIRTQSRSG